MRSGFWGLLRLRWSALPFLIFMELTIGAQVFITGHHTVGAFFSPACLCAPGILGATHATGAVVHVPTRIEFEIMAYRREIQPFRSKLLNELQSLEVFLGIESLPSPSLWGLNNSGSFPHPNGFGMYIQHFCHNAYRIDRSVQHIYTTYL